MSKVFSYARTMAGAARRAQQRGPIAPTVEAPKEERVLAKPPVAGNVPQCTFGPSNIVRLVIPRTEAQQIIADVAHAHGLTYADILSRSRKRKVVAARHDAVAAVKQAKPVISLEQLGRLFRRDYSSIRHALVRRGMAT